MLSTDARNYFFILRPKGRLFQTYVDILEGVSSPWRKLQTSQGLCKRLTRPGSRIKESLWERKNKSTATDLHILRLKLNMFCSPSKFHFTGSLGRIKSCLEKQKTWKQGHYIHLRHCCHTERDVTEEASGCHLLWFNKYPFLNQTSSKRHWIRAQPTLPRQHETW